jgi:sulfide:quinone oxidoreductase
LTAIGAQELARAVLNHPAGVGGEEVKNIAILGAGTAGTTMASKLAKVLSPKDWQITVIDRDNVHVYQPGLLFVPFGVYREEDLYRPRDVLLPSGAELRLDKVERIEADSNRVVFEGGDVIDYDILIVSTGTRIVPSETEGLAGAGWHESAFDFYTPEGAVGLAKKLDSFEGGRLVVNIVDMPIKCPVAPLEFAFLADWYLTERGIRDKVELVYATPLDGAFTKPKASAMLGHLLEERGVKVEAEFALSKVDGEKRVMESYDGRQLDYDVLVSVPLHSGQALVAKSGLGDEMGFVPTNKHTLQSNAHENIFVIGDATDLPASKAGSVAHFQSDVLFENIRDYIEGRELSASFDGHSNCFIETGYGKAMLIDFNYETEPLPGRFPLPGIGPFTLLEESHVNHWGKLAFKWAYWNFLVKGNEIPLDHRMAMAGKWS